MAALPNDADLDIKSVLLEIVRSGGAEMLKSVVEVYSAKFEKAPPPLPLVDPSLSPFGHHSRHS